ncbi:hypothetical protein UP09_36080 [Bradyrhizobium sp. LTSP885]|uniref:hypothetical protein n=1 Tax=Bradyrhizobium sp. LTSP885 TaxID=1619232 RepID=UPI0005C9D18B|nr:hypothetical protein [Bradyrhizobium sp. LTSP885]KJC33847.1 hypothetical protein UP09_36080 [Bradyrhizobium sp. LTSP885]
MKLFTGSVAAAVLALSAASAQAQLLAPYEIGNSLAIKVSDVEGPYAAMPEVPPPPRYGRVPSLLPPMEVYTVLRENGYLPLGAPRQRGFVYTIAVIDHGGDDGRLVIDARNGRIVRFTSAHDMDDNFDDELTATYGPAGPMPPPIQARVPRPPAPIPHVASRAVPVPKRSPLAARSAPAPVEATAPAPAATEAAAPAPAQQTAAAAPRPAEAQATQSNAKAETPTVGLAAPPAPAAPAILPTQDMPKVQGLE